MTEITSRSNPLIKHIVELHDAKGRARSQECIAQGIRTCTTLIKSGMTLKHLFCTNDTLEKAQSLASQDSIIKVSESVMQKINPVSQSSDIVCVFAIPASSTSTALSRGLVLANVSDPGNMGTLIRSAVAMDASSIVIIEGTDPWSPKVIHSSAGTIAQANIFKWTWQELLQHKGSLPLCALVVSGGNKPEEFTRTDMLLVVGNEAHGIPKTWIDDCEQKLTLAMPGNTESLNAAIAGSLALYTLFVYNNSR
jgi:TrmH family RNA methyltransferase